jgi:hypothetical protein
MALSLLNAFVWQIEVSSFCMMMMTGLEGKNLPPTPGVTNVSSDISLRNFFLTDFSFLFSKEAKIPFVSV